LKKDFKRKFLNTLEENAPCSWRAMPAQHEKKVTMVDEQIIQELCDRIVRDFQPERIILCGA